MPKILVILSLVWILSASAGEKTKIPGGVARLISVKYDCNYLYPDSTIAHFPDGEGELCLNWAKCVENMGIERHPDVPKGFTRFRAVACRPVDGRCPNVRTCAADSIKTREKGKNSNKIYDKYYDLNPEYVSLSEENTKSVKGDETTEFDKGVLFDDLQNMGKYSESKFVALFQNYPPPAGTTNFCLVPTTKFGEKNGGVVACFAKTKAGKVTCPSVEECLSKEHKVESRLATMAFSDPNPSSKTSIVSEDLRPHATQNAQTHAITTH
jgi:hypothetical protein